MSIHRNLKFYQKFFHASIPFFQIDSLDGTFFITGLAKGRMHNSCSSNAYRHNDSNLLSVTKIYIWPHLSNYKIQKLIIEVPWWL